MKLLLLLVAVLVGACTLFTNIVPATLELTLGRQVEPQFLRPHLE